MKNTDEATTEIHPIEKPGNSLPTHAKGHNHYLIAATSDNTRLAYRRDIQHFVNWGGLLPTTPEDIIRYLRSFATQLNPRTLMRRLTAIKHWHTYQGFLDPTAYPLVRKTLTGIMNVHGQPKRKAPAMTLEHLSRIVQYMATQNTFTMSRNNALIQLGFFGAFRVSELTHIQIEHINFVPEGMSILIPRSKTDQSAAGQYCAIPYGDDRLCAVTAVKNWCEKSGIQAGVLFREINRYQHLGTQPLLGTSVSVILKTLAARCDLPDATHFSSHSLRRGFATTASRKGASFASIMRHGRWRHEGTVFGYIEEGQQFESNAVRMILQKKPAET